MVLTMPSETRHDQGALDVGGVQLGGLHTILGIAAAYQLQTVFVYCSGLIRSARVTAWLVFHSLTHPQRSRSGSLSPPNPLAPRCGGRRCYR